MTTPFLTTFTVDVPEQSTVLLRGTITDNTGAGIPASSLTSLTISLYHQRTGGIINGRSGQSILNTNGGTIDTAGRMTMTLGPTDTVLDSQAREFAVITVELAWTYNGGTATGRALMRFTVRNFLKVT